MQPIRQHLRLIHNHNARKSAVVLCRCLVTRAVSPMTTRAATPSTTDRVPHLAAPDPTHASQAQHVRAVAHHLSQAGILKISLGFPDSESHYLTALITSLHKNHGHGLPITHSASRGWFWDVRPCPTTTTTTQIKTHQARSETMRDFPWHTDCSYEDAPPRFFALHVLRSDHCGGGTLSAMPVEPLTTLLAPTTTATLSRPEYRITIPPEFIKDPLRTSIVAPLLAGQSGTLIRFRGEIVTPLTGPAAAALDELRSVLKDSFVSALHLTAADLPAGSVVMLDNARWLHARNRILDPKRHLRRVRWHAVPFGMGMGVCHGV